jgi:primosomal replication protein N
MNQNFQISFADHEDVPRIIEILAKHADDHGEPYDLEKAYCHIHAIISDPRSIILTSIDASPQLIITGFIAIHLVSHSTSNEIHAYKLHWVVDKSYPSRGIELLKAGEHWAKLHGATKYLTSVREERACLLMKRHKFNLKSFIFEKNI